MKKKTPGVDEDFVTMPRRDFIGSVVTLAAAAMVAPAFAAEAEKELVSIEKFSASGVSEGVEQVPKVIKTEMQWMAQLPSRLAYQVTRHDDTEQAYSGEHNDNHADGIYRCICCDNALYDSKTKFESGTGWPSFWQPISAHNITRLNDNSHGMQRIAVECRRCDAHLGHVFEDGPLPTGLRYCMNSVSLKFAPRA